MMGHETHYVQSFAKQWNGRERAACGQYVDSVDHALKPTCWRCKIALLEDDQKRERESVSVAEVVERY
jgi:hypothetical protein